MTSRIVGVAFYCRRAHNVLPFQMGKKIAVVFSTLLLAAISPLRSFTVTTSTWNGLAAVVNKQKSPSIGIVRPHHSDRRSSHDRTARRTTTATTSLHCICINCAYVTNCTIYHFVEEQHEQPHLTKTPTFTPRRGSPRMHVTTKPPTETDWAKFWQAQENAKNEAEARAAAELDLSVDTTTVRVAAAAFPTSTTEYDVVKCEDFILDQGIWIRNMPEEIRRVNPDFVPT
jgi:hypothetical protein